MKATGIVRKIDELGRLVLPIELRRSLGIEEKDSLEIYVDGDGIVLRKYQPGCVICGSVNKLAYVSGTPICQECIDKMPKAAAEAKS